MISDENAYVRRESNLYDIEHFVAKLNQITFELKGSSPPISIISVSKNNTELTTDLYSFDYYRTVTIPTAEEDDVITIEFGKIAKDEEINDMITYAKNEVNSVLGTQYSLDDLTDCPLWQEKYLKLAAGFLILKHWEGLKKGEEFRSYGRYLIDHVHKQLKTILNGDQELYDSSGNLISRNTSGYSTEVVTYFEWDGVIDNIPTSDYYSLTVEDD